MSKKDFKTPTEKLKYWNTKRTVGAAIQENIEHATKLQIGSGLVKLSAFLVRFAPTKHLKPITTTIENQRLCNGYALSITDKPTVNVLTKGYFPF